MATDSKIKTASVLAFERKLDTSDALFSSGRWEDREKGEAWPPVALREKAVRGTISNRLSGTAADPAKLDAQIQSPNLQTVDVSALPSDADTLRVHFTLKVMPGAGRPSACNRADYQEKLSKIVEGYREQHGFRELARRYAYNLANGRFLWRNRLGSEAVEVNVSRLVNGAEETKWSFSALDFSLRAFDGPDKEKVEDLAGVIREGLLGEGFVLLEVVSYARMGQAQEVFPSQDLVLDRSNAKGAKSKTLYSVGDVAAMHSQKIGNALRTIDTWYPDEENDDIGPIAVEPYGSVTSMGKAFRQPKQKFDFYSLLDGWLIKDNVPTVEQQHFVMATLIRGGVFGQTEK